MRASGTWMVAVLFALTAGAPAASADDAVGRQSLELYCSKCHPVAGRGGAREMEAPDLALLSRRYGTPLPTVQLVDVILPQAVPVGTPYCGKYVLPSHDRYVFADLARRGTILEILRYLDGIQGKDHAQTP